MIWDNHNRAIDFREDILNLHSLNDEQLNNLLENLEDSEIDNYMPISELIGVAFDENSVWGQCDIGELKGLIHLSLKNYIETKVFVDSFLTFNDSLAIRKKYYQALSIILEIILDKSLKMEDYTKSLNKMYGKDFIETVLKSSTGEIRFYGLTTTDMSLKDQDKHLRLIESYKKLIVARNKK